MFSFRSLVSSAPAYARPVLPRRRVLQTYQHCLINERIIPPSITRQNHSSATHRLNVCPSCSSPLPTALPVCASCSYIAPIPESMTYHEMLGTSYEPNPFVVDVPKLKDQFRKVQAVVHPDRWVAKPPEQQGIAAAMSSRINEALHQLSSPLKRAEYILAREGHMGGEEDTLEDAEILMDIMEAHEGMAHAETQEEVALIRSENDEKVAGALGEIERAVGEKDWEALRKAAVKLKYLTGVDSAAAAWPERAHSH